MSDVTWDLYGDSEVTKIEALLYGVSETVLGAINIVLGEDYKELKDIPVDDLERLNLFLQIARELNSASHVVKWRSIDVGDCI